MTEVAALDGALRKREDIHIKVGKWAWTPEDQFPPAKTIMCGVSCTFAGDGQGVCRGRVHVSVDVVLSGCVVFHLPCAGEPVSCVYDE